MTPELRIPEHCFTDEPMFTAPELLTSEMLEMCPIEDKNIFEKKPIPWDTLSVKRWEMNEVQ